VTPDVAVPALLAAALLAWTPSLAGGRARIGALRLQRPPDATPLDTSAGEAPAAWQRWLLAGSAGLATGLVLGGVVGVIGGIGIGIGAERALLRRSSDAVRAAGAALTRDLPIACDLLGVCLAAGVPVSGALSAVGDALPAPLGASLRAVASLYRLGAATRTAWADAPPELAALGRVLVRAGESGSSVVPALRALADDSRTAARAAAEAAVHRAGIWVLAPLGACFLPAFLCLGVVPLVLGIAGDVFR
jgi:pilus assembly protein TadC